MSEPEEVLNEMREAQRRKRKALWARIKAEEPALATLLTEANEAFGVDGEPGVQDFNYQPKED